MDITVSMLGDCSVVVKASTKDEVTDPHTLTECFNTWTASLAAIKQSLTNHCHPPREILDSKSSVLGVRVYTFYNRCEAVQGYRVILAKITELKLRGWW